MGIVRLREHPKWPPRRGEKSRTDRQRSDGGIRRVGLNRADLSPGLGNFALFNEHLCPSVWEDKTSKHTYGADFHVLSAGLIGHVTCSLRICSHFTERDRRRKDPAFRAFKEAL
jgi:hypothetical protein